VRFSRTSAGGSNGAGRRFPTANLRWPLVALIPAAVFALRAHAAEPAIVFTQLPPHTTLEQDEPPPGGLRASYGEGGRIVMLAAGAGPRVLTDGFHSACDPEVSFDGRRMLFAGKQRASDAWNIFEADLGAATIRQVTRDAGNCRSPVYAGTIYTIVDSAPSEQIVFVSDLAGELGEFAPVPSTSLYACRMDGSVVRRLTYNPSSDLDPAILPDGRLVFSSRQRARLEHGFEGRFPLFAAQTDGLDYAIFSGDEGRRVKQMPCATTDRSVIFVESDRVRWDGAGALGSVSLRRNLSSHRKLTDESDGLFHSPSALPDGGILVSRRPAEGSGTHGIWRMDPATGRLDPVFDDPQLHDIQAKAVAPRPRAEGRSSVVSEEFSTGTFYCLNVYESDLRERGWIAPGTPARLRVLEGIPRTATGLDLAPQERARATADGYHAAGIPPLLERRILGEIRVEPDGSFNVEVPANVPIELQLLDSDGVALRSCGWIWVRQRETRGCVGCHESGELTPPNRLVRAVTQPSVPLTLPREKRRTVDFRRDVRPVLSARCATASCHVAAGAAPLLAEEATGRGAFDPAYAKLLAGTWIEGASASPFGAFVHPGRARTSPLTWHLLGKPTSRPWDAAGADGVPAPIPSVGSALTEDEKRLLVEWIDLGAPWNNVETGGAR
jgi:hypothetical protein